MLNCIRSIEKSYTIFLLGHTLKPQLNIFHSIRLFASFTHEDKKINTYKRKNFTRKTANFNENDSFLRIETFNPRSGSKMLNKFRLPAESLSERASKTRKHLAYDDELTSKFDHEDLESSLKEDKNLDLFIENPNFYHRKQIEEDIHQRKLNKRAIIRKKLLKIEGRQVINFNLLTWDAKEQIKYLHLNEPGKI